MLDYLHLVVAAPENNLLYAGSYDPVLVSLSIIVAIFASYAALLVSQHVTAAATRMLKYSWLTVGGLCLGLGIWAMHFVGMLSFNLPCSSSYDYSITLLSTIPGILASMLALSIISRRQLSSMRLATGGLLLGAGIGAMHYSGMAAMRLDGLIRYDLKLFLLSIVVAVVLATLALWMKFRLSSLRSSWRARAPVIGAIVMGLAVAGMHYTAMAAAYFIRDGDTAIVDSQISSTFLASSVLLATGVITVVTIVATYVGKSNLFSFERSYRLVGLLIAGWSAVAWLSADYFHSRLVKDLYRQESQLAKQQAASVAGNIEESLQLLKSVPLVFARDEEIRRALRGFGTNAIPSNVDYARRKQQWTHDARLGELDASLKIAATNFKADVLWIVNAAGDCIAANNADEPESFVGTNYADREYFRQARAGQRGHQYAMGRASKVAGLFYSYPIVEKGQFLGAAVVKRNISRLADWTNQAKAFISDANGVIVLATDSKLEFRTLPSAGVVALSQEKKLLQYKRSSFAPLQITPWGDGLLPSAVRIGDDESPVVLITQALPEDAIAIHVPRPLTELIHLSNQRFWLFLLLMVAGSMLIVAASAIVLYLREAQKTEADLRVAATAFESQEGMVITDAANVILRINRAFTDITGYTAADIVGRELSIFDTSRHDADFHAGIWRSVHRDGSWQGEIWNRRKNGEAYPESLTITAVKGAAGNITHYVSALTDITQRKTAEEEIKNLALYDFLTRLPNRRCLMERLQQALAASARSGRQGALLFIDLDNFKDINDTLGHNMGDLLLQQTAQRFTACVRESDTVARLGGDEFVVMLENLCENPQEAAEQVAVVGEKILDTLNQPYLLGTHQFSCTSSVGVTLFLGHSENIEDLLKQTDLAMYQAKAAGRNTLRFFNPSMQAAVTARTALDTDLRQGLQLSQFQLYYQPQVDGAGRLTGAEALIRWHHPQRGTVSPAEFIPAAEESGLILPLGQWVLETACSQLVAWAAQPETAHLSLAVNVSPRQFRHADFVGQVLAMLDRLGVDPCKLKLELTESLLLDDVEETVAKMMALKTRGVGFSLDDFGTGYSSLSYLKRLPFFQLKIDQSFVRNILNNPNDAAITKTIMALAQSMGLAVIAEGVESEEQRNFLAGQGCHAYQGYLFGRPQPPEAFIQFLRR
ncbi:bifunctional diguanylate cyclase/phosphodiesterase [Undibacterium sp.]|jgi:diguanylate cyclase (GGDEF)-like protein/PAS domain S-box-containing protein|uniref:bifunctional diguanylate cyclase/phosphodiesterase n=1 Tax=Undibacterium sp. TaxID=1914977 RepID=UPI002CB30BDD|nr:EAL domain-containing protein [Undibacterium sp.]HTD03549.1 EAL domain-containing protein [Undibacterium sp.]